jgi:hypothetical protein
MDAKTLASFRAQDDLRIGRTTVFGKPGRDIATLAGIQIVCFLTLSRLEPHFFIVHLYQVIPYVAILIFLGYGEDRWAYMIGTLVSIALFGLTYLAGLLSSAVEHLRTFRNNSLDVNLVALLTIVVAIAAVLMAVLSRIHWVKEYSGRVSTWRTFLVSFGIVSAYYAVLARWFWDMMR